MDGRAKQRMVEHGIACMECGRTVPGRWAGAFQGAGRRIDRCAHAARSALR